MNVKKYTKALNATILLVICGWIAFLHPFWVLIIGIFTPLVGYFVVLVGLSPLGQITLGKETNKPTLSQWCLQLLLGQIAIVILTWAGAVAFLGAGPPYGNQTITAPELSSMLLHYRAWWGIFPWGVFALWGLIIAYLVYVKKWLPFLYQTAQDFCPRRFQAFFKASIETATSASSVLAIAFCVCTVILLITYACQLFMKNNHFEVPVVTVLFFSVIMLLCSFKPFLKKIQRLTNRYGLTALLAIFIPIIILTLVLASFGNTWFIAKNPEIYKQAQCPQCLNYFRNVSHETRLAVLYWGWWIIWTPFAGTYLAKISKGRTIREFMIGVFLVPLLLFVLYWIFGSNPFMWVLDKMIVTNSAPAYLILAALSWLILSRLVRKQVNTNFFISGLMVSPDCPEDRLKLSTGSKKVALSLYATRLFMAVVGTLFLQTMAGWYGAQIQIGAVAIHMICTIYLGGLFIIARFGKDKIWELSKS